MNDASISIAVEDKYVIFRLHKPLGMLPDENVLDRLLYSFAPLRRVYSPILDLSDAEVITEDIRSFALGWSQEGATTIVDREQTELIEQWPRRLGPLIKVDRRDWRFEEISLVHFLDPDDIPIYGLQQQLDGVVEIAGKEVPTEEEWDLACWDPVFEEVFGTYNKCKRHYEAQLESGRFRNLRGDGESVIVGYRYWREMLKEIGRNSLMTQMMLLPGQGSSIVAVPYHANALYEAVPEMGDNQVILARPSALAERTGAILSEGLYEFSHLLSEPSSSEHDFQRFFERNDTFIKLLGYKRVYPKVVLQRDDGTSLQPDFMLEPFDSNFWDILDLKKPNASLIVGARDRKDFSAQVHQLHAQLREYRSYFDEEKYRKRIYDRYGIKAYKPRLVGVIGTNYDISDELQLRRVLTQYKDSQFYTFEQLRDIARTRLLI